MRTPASLAATLLLALLAAPTEGLARSSDRDKPMDINADDIDHALDGSRPATLSGNVVITQGTLDIRSARAEVTVRGSEPTRVVLTGSPATLTQEMDDGSPFSANAQRVDYDLDTDIVTLTGNVVVKQRGNTMNGPKVVYNMGTGRVQASGNASEGGRVNLRLVPNRAPRPTNGSEGG